MSENTIDELMRRPAVDWKGPKDPDLDELIKYMRVDRAKDGGGRRAKRSEISEKVDPDLLKIVMDGRGVTKPKAYRRF